MTDPEQIAADWAARGFSCELWTDPPGQSWEDFRHATDEVVIVLEGGMEFEVEGQVHRPEPGEEVLIPAGAVHSARNIGSTDTATIEARSSPQWNGERKDAEQDTDCRSGAKRPLGSH